MNVKVLRSPSGTVDGANDLVKPGSVVSTVRSSVAVPLLPWLEVRSPVRLVCTPALDAVTSTSIVHDEDPPRSPSDREIVVPPAGAVKVPPQELDVLAASAIVIAPGVTGRTSVNARSVIGSTSGLSIVNVSVATLPGPIVSGANTLENDGGGLPAVVGCDVPIDTMTVKSIARANGTRSRSIVLVTACPPTMIAPVAVRQVGQYTMLSAAWRPASRAETGRRACVRRRC